MLQRKAQVVLINRITVVRCDNCSVEAKIEHDICGSSNGQFNNALAEAGWGEPFSKKDNGYLHLCPACCLIFKVSESLQEDKTKEIHSFTQVIQELAQYMSMAEICEWLQAPIPALYGSKGLENFPDDCSPLNLISHGEVDIVLRLIKSYESGLIS